MYILFISLVFSLKPYQSLAHDNISDWSLDLNKSHVELKPKINLTKEKIIKRKICPLKSAILWNSPPIDMLGIELNPIDDRERDKFIKEILINSLLANHPELKKSKIKKFGKRIIENFFVLNSLDQDDYQSSLSLIEKNLLIYKSGFFSDQIREADFKNQFENSKLNLEFFTSKNTIEEIKRIYTGANYAL